MMHLLQAAGEVAEQAATAVSDAATATVEKVQEVATNATVAVSNVAEKTQGAEKAGGSSWTFWIMIGLMLLVMYLFMWRPESKRRKEMQKFREGLRKGDKIVTAGGIYGVVKEIDDATILIEVDGNVTLRVDKGMVVADASAQRQQK